MEPSQLPGRARTALVTLAALVAAIVWTHAIAGALRAAAGVPVTAFAEASAGLTVAAVLAALAGCTALRARRPALSAIGRTLLAGGAAWGALALLVPAALVPGLALLPAAAAGAGLAAWAARRLPASLDELALRRPRTALAWSAVALLAVVQIGRLATYMNDVESDWFLSTRHPFYAKHECVSAYYYGAELARRGDPDVYDPAHYPGLNPEAEPQTELVGMSPEDPYQYPPPFLLLPTLGIALTSDYGALRLVWFGLNVTLCLGAVLALALWVGGRAGTTAALLAPAVLASFPVLHDFQYGQFHFASIALAVLGLIAFQRERRALGGSLLAASILAKLFPGVLVVSLAAQRRWRDLAWTAGAGVAMSLLALGVLGPAPFEAFVTEHLPRLADGSAFAFGEAWPEFADLLTAGNQGIAGIVHKLSAMGVTGADDAAGIAGQVFELALIAAALLVGLRASRATRAVRAIGWLGLLGLGSLASTGAWADYVPLTCVWLLTWLAPFGKGRPVLAAALGLCALFQLTLLGTVPLGSATSPSWMLPLSLAGALLMLATFAGAVLVRPEASRELATDAAAEPATRLAAKA